MVTFLLFYTFSLPAQTDTLKTEAGKIEPTANTVIVRDSTVGKVPKEHSPKKAALYSAVLPGLGQMYNKKYWKVPVLYAFAGGIGYAMYKTNSNYQDFRLAYRLRLDGDTTLYSNYNLSQLKQARDYWHRYRDLSIVGAVFLYGLQIIDATVDAHLFGFKERINDDLTIELRPQPYMGMVNGKRVNGCSLSVTF